VKRSRWDNKENRKKVNNRENRNNRINRNKGRSRNKNKDKSRNIESKEEMVYDLMNERRDVLVLLPVFELFRARNSDAIR